MAMQPPFNLNRWIDENRALLKPPVGNKNVFPLSEDYIIMVVAGPNARKDYHYNETEEFFYQLEGQIKVIVQDQGQRRELHLGPGDVYLHPAKTPHSPVRSADSIGLVIERVRAGKGFTDGLLWFCENCNHKLYEVYFELHDIEKDFLPHYEHFYNSETLRTCQKCGEQMPADPKYLSPDR